MSSKLQSCITFYRSVLLVLGNTVLLLVLLEMLLRIGFSVHDRREHRRQLGAVVDGRSQADVYGGADWVDDYWREFNRRGMRWESYVYWRRQAFTGAYINVSSNGIRQTWNQTIVGEDVPSVLMFGGSTMWGSGARDDFTIPSFVSRQLSDRGVRVHVTNFGESGYVSSQEVILLMTLLRQGWRPQVVVFYDGANDTFSAYQQGVAGLPQNEANRREEFNVLKDLDRLAPKVISTRLNRLALCRFGNWVRWRVNAGVPQGTKSGSRYASPAHPEASGQIARQVADIYLSNIRIVKSLGEVYGFQTLFYLQPTLFTKKVQTVYEKGRESRAGRNYPQMKPFFVSVYSAVQTNSIKVTSYHDLSDLFASRADPAYIDWCHLGEEGNRVVAEQMTGDIMNVLERNADAPSKR
jgi:hypothetical protein